MITLTRHTILRRTPLDEGSARRRDLYLTTHNSQKRPTSFPRRDSKSQSQQTNGHRTTSWVTCPPGWAADKFLSLYGISMFISEITTTYNVCLPLTTLIQSTVSNFYSLKINLNTPPSMLRTTKWSVSFRLPNQNLLSIRGSFPSYALHVEPISSSFV